LFPAENTGHLVFVGVVALIRSPLLLVIGPVVVLLALILAILLSWILLTRQGELLLTVLCNGLNTVFFFLLMNRLDVQSGPGFVLKAELDGGQPDRRIQIQSWHGLQVNDSV
jgi:hypothetical protein